jgi:mRNA interferase MazF
MVDRPLRGHVYWVDFDPVRGSEQGGRRPALVVQNDLGNLTSTVTVVVAVTSVLPRKRYPFHVWLDPQLLPKQSVVLCEQIRTVAKDRLEGPALAALPAEVMAEVETAISLHLGLA